MIAKETREGSGGPGAFRLDVQLHQLLTKVPVEACYADRRRGIDASPAGFSPISGETGRNASRRCGKPRCPPPPLDRAARNALSSRLAYPLRAVASASRRLSSDHRLPVYRVEVQPGLPLLLGVRQLREGNDRRHGAALDRLAARFRMRRPRAHGRRAAATAAIRAQSGLLRRKKGLLGVRSHQCAAAASRGDRPLSRCRSRERELRRRCGG